MKFWRDPLLKRAGLLIAVAALASASLIGQGSQAPSEAAPSAVTPPQTPPAVGSNDAAFRRVSNRLLCQCGCGYMVLSCNHVDCSSATFIRRTIQTKLAAGQGEDAIVAGFIDQYGPRILPEPPKQGFSWSAWIAPFAVLVLGGLFLSYFLWQWKHHQYAPAGGEAEAGEAGSPDASSPSPVAPEVVAKYSAQINRDLENE